MANPTQQPPGGFVAANFTEPGPFSQYLQAPAQQAVQATQAPTQHWNGREGALGVGAGLLTNWINGASAGRAKALAQQHEREMQNANRVNQFRQMVADSDLHPDDKRNLIAEAHNLEQAAINDHIVAAGKKNPFLKALGVVHQTIMGGPPADEFVDPRTGETHKRQIGTVDQHQLDLLYQKLHATPNEGALYTAATQNMYQKLADSYKNIQAKNPGAPVTQQMMLSEAPDLWKESQVLQEKFPNRPSPFSVFLNGLPGQMDPMKAFEYKVMSDAYGGGQSPTAAQLVTGQAPALQGGIPGMPNQGMASSYLGTNQMPVIAPSGKQFQHVATNQDGHQIGSDDLQNWVDIKTGQKVQ